MIRISLTMAAALAVLPLACKQDKGERCQIDPDCSEGLVCCPNDEEDPAAGGICDDKCGDDAVGDAGTDGPAGADGPSGTDGPGADGPAGTDGPGGDGPSSTDGPSGTDGPMDMGEAG